MTEITTPQVGNVITTQLQEAIDRTAAAGGGRVTIPAGRWIAGAIQLRSGIDLHVPLGATLACSEDYDDFATGQVSVVAEDSDRGFLVARGAQNVSVTGKGTIHGSGPNWCSREGLFDGVKWAKFHRPRMVVFEACRDVEIRDVTFLEAPMWTVHLIGCDQVRVTDLSILNDMLMPNTDGVNFDSCRDVFMSGCRIVAADDSVCVKTCAKLDTALEGPAERIHVTNCHFTSRSCSVKIGTETHQDVRDVVLSGLTITGTNRAFGIMARDGGTIERIRFANSTVDCSQAPHTYWGSGEPITINAHARVRGATPSRVRDIAVHGITGRCEGAIVVHGDPDMPIENVQISAVNLRQEPGDFRHELFLDLRPVPEDVNDLDDPELGRRNCFVRRPDGGIYGMDAYPNGLPGVLVRHARAVHIDSVRIDRPSPLPQGWARDVLDQAE
ncbi:Polygalacturonase [Candidatus Rhodobacter oscarellae]|uniref:Polygalacturonase n=1 Tax=Candidatus Rhodobacter oscarellae TaxID=1675527 RepID=A0A0J9E1Z9_9RHOB|nr:glycosyl hydrolase family 28 protein [Candidatus Rhodobacter lobularis]KMW56896.1 Polygalacturonase [Candidatus Rhodobacter lobularis]